MLTIFGHEADFVRRACELLEHLEGTATLERVELTASLERAYAVQMDSLDTIREIEQRLKELPF